MQCTGCGVVGEAKELFHKQKGLHKKFSCKCKVCRREEAKERRKRIKLQESKSKPTLAYPELFERTFSERVTKARTFGEKCRILAKEIEAEKKEERRKRRDRENARLRREEAKERARQKQIEKNAKRERDYSRQYPNYHFRAVDTGELYRIVEDIPGNTWYICRRVDSALLKGRDTITTMGETYEIVPCS